MSEYFPHNAIDQLVNNNKIVFFGKGEKGEPECGFTAKVQDALEQIYPEYLMINILANPALRMEMKTYSDWQTFPQVYIDGEFVGGCDIVLEMSENGELDKIIKK